MGNSQSNEVEQFKKFYDKHGQSEDPRYGKVEFYHHKHTPEELVMLKENWTNSLSESQDINAHIENRKDVSHPNLARNLNYV